MWQSLVLTLLLLLTALAAPAHARTSQLCLDAIDQTERRQGWLPKGLLRSIALVESGYKAKSDGRWVPWPWTINSPAGSFYLDSRRQAIAKVEDLRRQGITNIDVGCMQINLHFHPNAFHNLDAAFRPESNVAYAARFLGELFDANRDLFQAVGRYHSATPNRRDAYARKVFARWDKDAGISIPSRHGVGPADSPRLVEREPEPAPIRTAQNATGDRVWRGVYGRQSGGSRLIDRASGNSLFTTGAGATPTEPRRAGQIVHR